MIPKIIHYCWFGKGLMPASQKAYIQTWKKFMPGYEIKRWDESNFDINCNAYVRHAYDRKMFAYVSDYARLWALYNEGGFYFDTDVELFRSLDSLCTHRFLSGIEYFVEFEDFNHLLNENRLPIIPGTIIPNLGFLSAVLGSEANNKLINDTLQFYNRLKPQDKDFNGIVIDGVMAREAIKYGFIYQNNQQILAEDMLLLPSSLFCSMPNQRTRNSYLLHHCAQSWCPKTKNQQLQLFLDKLHLLTIYKKITAMKRQLLSK